MGEDCVFISYAHEDRPLVEDLAARLEQAGVPAWFDRELKPGRPWSKKLEDRIAQTRAVLVVLTPCSAASVYVGKEVHFAEQKGKRIIPVLSRDCDVPLALADLQ